MKMITLISCPLSLHGFPSRWEGGKDANERNVDAISETWGVSVVCRCQYFKLLSFPVGGTRWAETDVQVSSVLRYFLGARFWVNLHRWLSRSQFSYWGVSSWLLSEPDEPVRRSAIFHCPSVFSVEVEPGKFGKATDLKLFKLSVGSFSHADINACSLLSMSWMLWK